MNRAQTPEQTAPLTVLYDGECPFCRTQMTRLRRWDKHGQLRLLATQDRLVPEEYPQLDPLALLREMHVVEDSGAVHRGGDAVLLLARRLFPNPLVRLLLGLPLLPTLVRAGYPMVASRRGRDGAATCTDAACVPHRQPNSKADLGPRGRKLAAVWSVSLLAAVLLPVVQNWREKPRDSFPLSHYPMFSQERGETYRMHHAVGITTDGERVPISYRRIGTGGFNAVRRQLRRMARSDDAALLQAYTVAIAERVAASNRSAERDLVEVRIVRATYEIGPYFLERRRDPVREVVLSRAAVVREVSEPERTVADEEDGDEQT